MFIKEVQKINNTSRLIDVKQALVLLSPANNTDRFRYSEQTETAQFNGTKQRRKQQETRSKS
jgi:hypothetical protein